MYFVGGVSSRTQVNVAVVRLQSTRPL